MEKITVHGELEAAWVYRQANAELRAKMKAYISLQILDAENHRLSLHDLMDLISTKARERVLTEP